MSEQTLVIEPSYPIKVLNHIVRVIVIGCGGTGSYFIRDIARSLSTLGRKCELILIDGDTVEEKNLRRQNFVGADIGRNKAEVMAERYAALGIQIQYQDKYLQSADELSKLIGDITGTKLIVSCVDNLKTRQLIRQAYLHSGESVYWIDSGNEEFNGQVVLCHNAPGWNYSSIKTGYYPMPDFFDLYPNMLELAKADKLPTELNCAEMAAASPQFGFVNATAAMLALNFAHSLLVARPIKNHVVDFSIDNSYSHRPLTETAIHAWGTYFVQMRGIKWLDESVNKRTRKAAVALTPELKSEPAKAPIKLELKSSSEAEDLKIKLQLLEALAGKTSTTT